MTENSTQEVVKDLEEYKFGFHDNAELEFTTGLGLTEEVIREISETKNEPEWMLEFRLKSFEAFKNWTCQNGAQIFLVLILMILFIIKTISKAARSWEDVPQEIKDTLKKLVFQKLNVHIWQELLLNMNQKLFIII